MPSASELNHNLKVSQTSMRSSTFTLKPQEKEPKLVRTSRSAWTPRQDPKNNHKLFLERISLLTHWHEKWNEKQRKQLLVHLLRRTTESEMLAIRAWIMKHIPEPQWVVDPVSMLPKALMLYILSFLNTAQLCECSKVSTHWRYLSEQDVLWRHRTASRGWYLPYNPPPNMFGAWKRYYVQCIKNSRHPSQLLPAHQHDHHPSADVEPVPFSQTDVIRLSKFFKETEEREAEPEPESRIVERKAYTKDVDESLYKERWYDPEKHPKDLDNWFKVLYKSYEPDVKHLRKSMPIMAFSKREEDQVQHTRSVNFDSGIGLNSLQRPLSLEPTQKFMTLSEVYINEGPFRISYNAEGKTEFVTKKGIKVPTDNYWLQKPEKGTVTFKGISSSTRCKRRVGAKKASELAGHIGCGAVWGDNIPGFTHPRVLLISSNVPVYEMIVDAVLPGVIGIVYDAEKSPIRAILNQVEHCLNDRKAQSIGIICAGELGKLKVTNHVHVDSENLHSAFWKSLVGMLIDPKYEGRIDILSSTGMSTTNQSLGLDLVYQLSGLTSTPCNGPIGGIDGDWGEIFGPWLIHPDNIHPLSFYLRENKLRAWSGFASQLDAICRDMRSRYRDRLQMESTAGLHRVVNAVLREGLKIHSEIEHVHLADVLFYVLSKLQEEKQNTSSLESKDDLNRGFLSMKIVDILLSSSFVNNLDDKKEDDDGDNSLCDDTTSGLGTTELEEHKTAGKDLILFADHIGKSVNYVLEKNSHRLIFPRGPIVDQRSAVLEELLQSEKLFLRNVLLLERWFYIPLTKSLAQNSPIISANQMKVCFSDIISLIRLHEVFYGRLLKKAEHWSPDEVLGDAINQLTDRFDCYTNYVNNYPAIITILNRNLNHNPAFWAYIEKFNEKYKKQKTVFEILQLPFSRVSELEAVVKSAIYYTSDKHPDFGILKHCASEFTKLQDFISQCSSRYAHLSELKELEQTIRNCPMLTETKRSLLHKVDVYKIKSIIDKSGESITFEADKEFPYHKKFKLYLFNDCLMIVKILFDIDPFMDTPKEVQTFVNSFSLASIRIKNVDGEEKQFILYTTDYCYLFQCLSADYMATWVDKANSAILNAPKLIIPNVYADNNVESTM